jgi:hypothetical protein
MGRALVLGTVGVGSDGAHATLLVFGVLSKGGFDDFILGVDCTGVSRSGMWGSVSVSTGCAGMRMHDIYLHFTSLLRSGIDWPLVFSRYPLSAGFLSHTKNTDADDVSIVLLSQLMVGGQVRVTE